MNTWYLCLWQLLLSFRGKTFFEGMYCTHRLHLTYNKRRSYDTRRLVLYFFTRSCSDWPLDIRWIYRLLRGLDFSRFLFESCLKSFDGSGAQEQARKYQGPLAACARCAGTIPELQSSLVSDMPKKTQAAKMEKKWDEYLNIYDFSVPTFFSIPICALLLLVRTLGFPTRPWWASRTGRYPPRPWGQAEYQELSTVTITLEYHKYVDQILNMNTLPPPSSPSSRRTTSHHILSSFTSHRSSIKNQLQHHDSRLNSSLTVHHSWHISQCCQFF